MFKLVLQKAEEPEIKLPTSTGSSAFDCVDHNKLWTIVKMGIVKMENGNTRTPDLPLEKSVCRSESTVRAGHGTTDWFQTGKGVCQGFMLSPCLFNLYAEYIMRNAGLDKAETGIKIARKYQ